MRIILACLLAVLSSGCVVALRTPFASSMRSPCPSERSTTLGQIVACRRVYVDRDIASYGSRGMLSSALERSGVRVMQGSSGDDRDYLVISARDDYNSYGNSRRVTVEVRRPSGELLYFGDDLASEGDIYSLADALRHAKGNMCVVEDWPCD